MTTHCKSKNFACTHDECNKKYSYKSSLLRHVQIVHHKKKYHCPVCRTSFSQQAQRSLHVAVKHRKTDRFRCLYCEVKVCFGSSGALRKHVDKRHGDILEVTQEFQICVTRNVGSGILTVDVPRIPSPNEEPSVLSSPQKLKLLCQFCYREFKNRFTLTRHINENHTSKNPKKNFNCSECTLNFKNKSSLIRHYKTQHLNEKKWNCSVCEKSFSRKYVFDHHVQTMHKKFIQSKMMPVFESKTKPDIQGVFQFDETKIKNHSGPSDSLSVITESVNKTESSYICKKCGACFTSKRGVNQHISLKHTESVTLSQKNKPSRIRDPLISMSKHASKKLTFDEEILDALKHGYSELENAGKLGACTESEKILYETLKKDKLVKDSKTQSTTEKSENFNAETSKLLTNLNSAATQENQPLSAKSSSKQRLHTCETCSQSFSRASDLKRHKLRHKREKLIFCEFSGCEKSFNNKSQRNQHFRMVHDKSKSKVECHVCGKNYASSSSLKVHMRNHVPNSEVYSCSNCGGCFKTSHAKKVHKCGQTTYEQLINT